MITSNGGTKTTTTNAGQYRQRVFGHLRNKKIPG
nr:MAG TPA: hypothetical protein [Microviridae sp.]